MSLSSPGSAPGHGLEDTSQPIGTLLPEEAGLFLKDLNQPVRPHPSFFAIFGGGYFMLFGYEHLIRRVSTEVSLLLSLALPLAGLLLLIIFMVAQKRVRRRLDGKQLEKMSITGPLSFGKPSFSPIPVAVMDVTSFAVGGHVFKDLPKDHSLGTAVGIYKFRDLIGAYENQTIRIDYGKDFPLAPLQIYTNDGAKVYDILSDAAMTTTV